MPGNLNVRRVVDSRQQKSENTAAQVLVKNLCKHSRLHRISPKSTTSSLLPSKNTRREQNERQQGEEEPRRTRLLERDQAEQVAMCAAWRQWIKDKRQGRDYEAKGAATAKRHSNLDGKKARYEKLHVRGKMFFSKARCGYQTLKILAALDFN